VGTDLDVAPGAALELDAKKWWMAVVVLVFVLRPRNSLGQSQAVGSNLCDHFPPELSLAVVGIQAPGESMCAVPLWWCWQEPPAGQEQKRTQWQVQGLALVLEQG